MAELQPLYTDSLCYSSQEDRLGIANLVQTEGVADVAGGDLLVTTGNSGLTVSIASGGAFIEGDTVTNQGMYSVFNNGAKIVTMTAANPTNPRIDQIIATVSDSTYGGADDSWVITKLDGTATAGANLTNLTGAAALPANSIPLAAILVPATFTGPFVNATHILDARIPYNQTHWTPVTFLNSWVNFGSTFQTVQYRKRGDLVDIRGLCKSGTVGLAAFQLPAGFRPPADVVYPASSNGAFGSAEVNSVGQVILLAGSNASFAVDKTFSIL